MSTNYTKKFGSFSSLLKYLLRELGVSQSEFSRKIGVHRTQVSNWKNGNNTPGDGSINKIGKAFNLRIRGDGKKGWSVEFVDRGKASSQIPKPPSVDPSDFEGGEISRRAMIRLLQQIEDTVRMIRDNLEAIDRSIESDDSGRNGSDGS